MTTKEKIIRQSIAENEKELAEIVALIDASPLLEIIGIRKRAQELIEGVKSGNTENLIEFKNLEKKKKRQFAIA